MSHYEYLIASFGSPVYSSFVNRLGQRLPALGHIMRATFV